MAAVSDDWQSMLASAIVAALREFIAWRPQGKPVVALDVGCFPWHGSFELSILTAEELDADPLLPESGEHAAWHHYNFAVGLTSWDSAASLGCQMSEEYYAASEADRPAVAVVFMRASAIAVASPEVSVAMLSLERDARFRVIVAHPDNGRQFYPPGQ